MIKLVSLYKLFLYIFLNQVTDFIGSCEIVCVNQYDFNCGWSSVTMVFISFHDRFLKISESRGTPIAVLLQHKLLSYGINDTAV